MNIQELATRAGIIFEDHSAHPGLKTAVITITDLQLFAELVDSDGDMAPCPYRMELYNDDSLCQCTAEQRHQCAMDV